MLEWDILNYLKKWRTNLRATSSIRLIKHKNAIDKIQLGFPFLLYELTDQGNKIFSVLFLFIFTNPVDVTKGFDCRGT